MQKQETTDRHLNMTMHAANSVIDGTEVNPPWQHSQGCGALRIRTRQQKKHTHLNCTICAIKK